MALKLDTTIYFIVLRREQSGGDERKEEALSAGISSKCFIRLSVANADGFGGKVEFKNVQRVFKIECVGVK